MKEWKNRLTKVALSLVVAGMLSGCHNDDTSDCPGTVYLRFNYTHNTSSEDRLRDQVQYLNLYFYNPAGELSRTQRVEVGQLDARGGISLNLPPDNYTMVAWGNNDAAQCEIRNAERLDDLRLSLREDAQGYVCHHSSLFHGRSSFVASVTEPVESQVSLIKNSNHIRVVLVDVTGTPPGTRGAEPLPGTDLRVRIRGCNWLYDGENNLDPAARQRAMEYQPTPSFSADGWPQAEFDILRMFSDNSCQLKLSVEDTRYADDYAEANPVHDLWLTQQIIDTVPEVNTDDDLNRHDDFEVRLEVKLGPDRTWSVHRILINDWEVGNSIGGI